MAAMLLALYGCGCTDTSGTMDGNAGMQGGTVGTNPTAGNDGTVGGAVDEGMDNIIGGLEGDMAGDEIIDGDNTDPANPQDGAGASGSTGSDNNGALQ